MFKNKYSDVTYENLNDVILQIINKTKNENDDKEKIAQAKRENEKTKKNLITKLKEKVNVLIEYSDSNSKNLVDIVDIFNLVKDNVKTLTTPYSDIITYKETLRSGVANRNKNEDEDLEKILVKACINFDEVEYFIGAGSFRPNLCSNITNVSNLDENLDENLAKVTERDFSVNRRLNT